MLATLELNILHFDFTFDAFVICFYPWWLHLCLPICKFSIYDPSLSLELWPMAFGLSCQLENHRQWKKTAKILQIGVSIQAEIEIKVITQIGNGNRALSSLSLFHICLKPVFGQLGCGFQFCLWPKVVTFGQHTWRLLNGLLLMCHDDGNYG